MARTTRQPSAGNSRPPSAGNQTAKPCGPRPGRGTRAASTRSTGTGINWQPVGPSVPRDLGRTPAQ
jgi:hypothetical protein